MFFNESNNRTRANDNGACANKIIHTIRSGDTLYSLANRYNTTVGRILADNPGTEIYNLRIGANLVICPGVMPVPPIGTPPPVTPVPPIGTLPPVTPELPIAPIPPICLPVDALRELVIFVLNWIREHFGEDNTRKILETFSDDVWKY